MAAGAVLGFRGSNCGFNDGRSWPDPTHFRGTRRLSLTFRFLTSKELLELLAWGSLLRPLGTSMHNVKLLSRQERPLSRIATLLYSVQFLY